MTPLELRDAIPATESVAYFNTGASGPSPRPVVDAVTECLQEHAYGSPGSDGMYAGADDVFTRAKTAVARLLSVDTDDLALTQSTTDGINIIANAIDWEPGDTVVRTDLEHGAGVLPWARLRDVHGITIEVVRHTNGRVDPEQFIDLVTDARLVCLSSLSWSHGTRLPVRDIVDIAHDVGTLVLVDAVQSIGHHTIDASSLGADFLVGGGHKWLLGPWGSGFLYSTREARRHLTPTRIGFRSVEIDQDDTYTYHDSGQMFEISTLPVGPYGGLEAAVSVHSELGLAAIHDRMEALTEHLKDGLGDRLVSPRTFESGLVTFEVAEPDAFVEFCRERDVVIRSLPGPNRVRASVHAFNTPAEIDQLLACVSSFTS